MPEMKRKFKLGELLVSAGKISQEQLDSALKRSKDGTRINGDTGRTTTTDGPFAEAKELVGGYAVLEAPSKEAAVALGAEFMQLHIDHGMPDIVVEVRQIDGGYNY